MLRHHMYVYEDDAAMASQMAPFLDDGVEQDDAVLAIVDQRKWALLRKALGRAAERVTHVDRDAMYRRPEATLAAYDATVRELVRGGARRIRTFAELPLCETAVECRDWIRYEAIVNRALARYPMWVICGYDTRERPPAMVRAGWHTHPTVLTSEWRESPRYDDPEAIVRALTPVPADLPGLPRMPTDVDAHEFRQMLREAMASAAVPEPEAGGMLLAASELYANALRHGRGARTMRAGEVDGRFVCEIGDRGPGLDDPLAGYNPPQPPDWRGAGLWIARQLTWRLELCSSRSGLTARLWV